jgi:hypothetical protein
MMPQKQKKQLGVEFIVGCQRSGTYLLCTILDSHFPAAVPVEPQFIPLFRRVLPLWGDLSVEANRKRLLAAIYEFLEIWTPRSERGKDYAKIHDHSLLITRQAAHKIASTAATYDEMVEAIFAEFARLKGKQFSIDKSAFFWFVDPDKMSVRSAKFIHIIRDGRDVALSWVPSWFGPATIAEAAEQWKCHVEGNRRWGRAHPDRYLEIRYEDLIADIDASLEKIARFLDVEKSKFDAAAHSRSPMVAALSGGEDHAMISKGINPDNRDKWRTRMNPADVRLFEYITADTLAACGYSLSSETSYSFAERLSFQGRICMSGIRRLVSIRFWKRLIKESLPIIVFWAQALHIPLSRIGRTKAS